MARVPSFKLFPHQREALKRIESWAAVPTEPVYYVNGLLHGEPVVLPLSAEQWNNLKRFTPPPPRFNTARLAAKLARSLHTKST